ncbi:P-II family nitrogen regulator [Tindallia californiensis]|uniref:Nitrogen regulatory protein PII n=1 Tax=Tindallia californiensis TaxID=159292 RepID=A0A1H3J1U3_9FIRM|nr:hypothetical protein [Tindallia californiensis]SDY33509.1 Nitrogen regulatory protein PII [Tindallia californiensis]
MEVLFLVLNQPERLNELMEGFLEDGISGATVLESTGMGRTLCDTMPIFGGLRKILQDCRPNNLTIFMVLNTEVQKDKVIQRIYQVLGDLNEPNTGMYFIMPVSAASGLTDSLIE